MAERSVPLIKMPTKLFQPQWNSCALPDLVTRRCLGISACLVLLVAGCSDPTKGIVQGQVTIDGVAPALGSIAFFPTDGKSSTAGGEIVNGKYSAKVSVGTSKVEIRVSKEGGKQKLYDTPDSPVQTILVEVLPDKYHDKTELLIEVKTGTNEQNYDLKTK